MYDLESDSQLERNHTKENPFPENAKEEKKLGIKFMQSYNIICPDCHDKEVNDGPQVSGRQCCKSLTDLEMTDEERIFWKDEIAFMMKNKN